MIKAIIIAIYSYIHFKGWCIKLHKERVDWHTGCPIADKMMLMLFPPLIVSREYGQEVKKSGFRPGSIIIDKQ